MGDPGGGGAVTNPPSLRAGDRIAVVAPSGPADPESLDRGCAALRGLGLDVVVGKHALDRDPGLTYLAGTDAERAADLQAAWCDPRVAAVFCARGGYGAARVLDHLDWAAMSRAAPKLLHGASDITALHAAFARRLSVATSFGPMVATGIPGAPPDALDHLRDGLFGAGAPVRGTHAPRGGRASGVLTGGNLTLLTSLLGTPYAPEPAAGRLVLLEDVDEAPYRVDRMLTQLLQAGWFDGAAGIVLGTWMRCGEPDAVLGDRLGPLGIPVLAGVPVGHGPRQLTVRLGAVAVLDADSLTLSPGDAPVDEERQ